MPWKIDFKGYPEEISDYIEFPTDLELLQQPMLDFAPAEWVMKHGTEFQKYLLNKAPIKNTAKHVLVSCVTRAVYDGIMINRIEIPEIGSTRNEWHLDSSSEGVCVHAICNDFGTEFNTNPFSLEIPDDITPDYYWWCEQSQLHGDKWGLTPKVSPTNRFVTFDRHWHRAVIPKKKGIRFFMRINEMNYMMVENEKYQRRQSFLYYGNEVFPNITHNDNGSITIFMPHQKDWKEPFVDGHVNETRLNGNKH